MDQTQRVTPGPQRLQALAQANKVRLARAELKRKIAYGDVSAAEIILACPEEAKSWSVGELLMSQRRWGINRCRKFLARNQIGELKPIGKLTERQRQLLAAQLKSCERFTPKEPVSADERITPIHSVEVTPLPEKKITPMPTPSPAPMFGRIHVARELVPA
jgi:hypothetical protein